MRSKMFVVCMLACACALSACGGPDVTHMNVDGGRVLSNNLGHTGFRVDDISTALSTKEGTPAWTIINEDQLESIGSQPAASASLSNLLRFSTPSDAEIAKLNATFTPEGGIAEFSMEGFSASKSAPIAAFNERFDAWTAQLNAIQTSVQEESRQRTEQMKLLTETVTAALEALAPLLQPIP